MIEETQVDMCRSKASGGRRCAGCDSPAARSAHNARRRANRAERARIAAWAGQVMGREVRDALMKCPPSEVKEWGQQFGVPEAEPATPVPAEALDPAAYGFPEGQRSQDLGTALYAEVESAEWAQGLSPEERDAIVEYTGPGYEEINMACRLGYTPEQMRDAGMGDMVGTMRSLDAAIESAQRRSEEAGEPARVTYRGIARPDPDGGSDDAEFYDVDPDETLSWAQEVFPVGATIEMPSHTSTTYDPAKAMTFAENSEAGGVVFEMLTRKGAYLDAVSTMQGEFSERERLLPRDTKWRVVGARVESIGFMDYTVVQLVDEDDVLAEHGPSSGVAEDPYKGWYDEDGGAGFLDPIAADASFDGEIPDFDSDDFDMGEEVPDLASSLTSMLQRPR